MCHVPRLNIIIVHAWGKEYSLHLAIHHSCIENHIPEASAVEGPIIDSNILSRVDCLGTHSTLSNVREEEE